MIDTVMRPGGGTLAVAMERVDKRFGDTVALAGADFDVRAGEVHALLGENGAGKTTLMRVLAGLTAPDAGRVMIGGEHVDRFDPRSMLERGIALVQQHFTLVPRFTATQNLVLARPLGARLPSRRAATARLDELAGRYGLPVRPDVPASRLAVGEQQRLELLRALDGDPRVLVLDEPTAVLTDDEADGLLAVCRRLADDGRAVVFISHRLREVVAGADRVTVLRAGSVVVAGEPVGAHDRGTLAEAMVGRRRPSPPAVAVLPGGVRLQVIGARAGRLEPLDLEVRGGEIVAIAGVDGNGQTELEAVVTGQRRPDAGAVSIDRRPLPVGRPRRRVEADVAYIPADRYRYGLARAMTYGDNLDLGRSRAWRSSRRRREDRARSRLDAWDVRGPRRGLAGQLSGGNAQKLVLARELAGDASIVVAGHPTRGLDPGAAGTVAERLIASAAAGAAVLWIGSELDELMAVAHRLVVLCTGRAPKEFAPPFDRHAIGLAMAGAT